MGFFVAVPLSNDLLVARQGQFSPEGHETQASGRISITEILSKTEHMAGLVRAQVNPLLYVSLGHSELDLAVGTQLSAQAL